jgi:hypothetical protein
MRPESFLFTIRHLRFVIFHLADFRLIGVVAFG